jgi:hypothetical protein
MAVGMPMATQTPTATPVTISVSMVSVQ